MWYDEDSKKEENKNETPTKMIKISSNQHMKRMESNTYISEIEYSEYERFFDKLVQNGSEYIKREDLMNYIHNFEGISREWQTGEFEAFIDFHIESIGKKEILDLKFCFLRK